MASRLQQIAYLVALLLVTTAGRAHAGCNVIPGTQRTFRAALAGVDRPFARPGDWVELTLDLAGCHAAAVPFSTTAGNQIVTLIFKGASGARHAVLLTEDCSAAESKRLACMADHPSVATATCIQVNEPTKPPALEVASTSRLRFRFPDTDDLLSAAGDEITFAGPLAIAISPSSAAELPCGLATDTCAQEPSLSACVDFLFSSEGEPCTDAPHDTFRHFTALPPANDYQAICDDPPSVCQSTSNDIRFAVDVDGNLLVPMDWRGVLVNRDRVPIARLLRATTPVEAFPGLARPILLPAGVLASYAPEGARLPPLFDPQRDPDASADLQLFGSSDAPDTVLRIARHGAARQCASGPDLGLPCTGDATCTGGGVCAAQPTCVGGANAGSACTTDADCPSGQCGPDLFDFGSRVVGGSGPVVLRFDSCIGGPQALAACTTDSECPGGQCSAFNLAALDPVSLDGLTQSTDLNAFVMSEAMLDRRLNDDLDQLDDVVRLGARASGNTTAIGSAGAEGRAVARLRQLPFSFPALEVDGPVVAFLEPEPAEGEFAAQDKNANGEIAETILRAYRLAGGSAHELLGGIDLAVDPALRINDRSLALAAGRLLVRVPESEGVQHVTRRVSVGHADAQGNDDSTDPAISADGRSVAFTSAATQPAFPENNGPARDVFVRDLVAGTTELISVDADDLAAYGESRTPAISADGRFVVFYSDAPDLVPDDTNADADLFLRDRCRSHGVAVDDCTEHTERVNLRDAGGQSIGGLTGSASSISGDGRYVAFVSDASDLVAGDTNGRVDAFVRDRCRSHGSPVPGCVPHTERVSVGAGGAQGDDDVESISAHAISDDGRFVTFVSSATNLVPGDTNDISDVFVRDRLFGTTERANVDSAGTQANAAFRGTATISADGRYVAFDSYASNLVAGDTNSGVDIFVHDRDTRVTERVSVDSTGRQIDGYNFTAPPTISGDGRFVVFTSLSDLVPGLTDGNGGVYVHDRLTGVTVRADRNAAGNPSGYTGSVEISGVAISFDGGVVVWESNSTSLVTGDTNGALDVFARIVDTGVTSGDRNGDGDGADTVLQSFPTDAPGPPSTLGPATTVRVTGGTVAFLRPEWAGAPGAPDGVDLNGDGDADDAVVQLAIGTAAPQNLGRAATDLVVADGWVGALVSEHAQDGRDLNGDGDTNDDVLAVHRAGAPPGAWTNVARAAKSVQAFGSLIAFVGDDGILRLYVTSDPLPGRRLIDLAQPVKDFVLGGEPGRELVAFRTAGTNELQVYDVERRVLRATGLVVTPCFLEACDPRIPYRVGIDTVKFLTLEAEQGIDLNGDGDAAAPDDLVLQIFNIRRATSQPTNDGATTMLAAVAAGICTNTARACATSANCCVGPTCDGSCILPPGGCIRNLGTSCDPAAPNQCSGGAFCVPILGAPHQGNCTVSEGPCSDNGQCTPPAECQDAAQNIEHLVEPLGTKHGRGEIFASAGRCLEDFGTPCTTNAQCTSNKRLTGRQFCGPGGTCQRQHRTCRANGDCPTNSTCSFDLLLATADDTDSDEIPDRLDNCPTVPNVLQTDTDGDGVGDDCQSVTCGNGIRELFEECDGSDAPSCPGSCRPDCTCPCQNALLDPDARIAVKAGHDAGIVNVKMVVPLAGYLNQSVRIRLDDADSTPIAERTVGALLPKGASGRIWEYRSKANGVQRIQLKDLAPKRPGFFQMTAKSKRWFTGAAANQAAADTHLTFAIGTVCFSHDATSKK